MDPVTIAAALAPILAPFARRAGGEVRDHLATSLGREAAEAFGGLWDRLRGRMPDAAADTAGDPDPAVFEQQLTRVLAAHPDLLREAASVVVTVQGAHNVVQSGGPNINITGGSDIHIGNR